MVVHVAVAMMGLLAFAALSIDLGTVWVVRAQVQNAADAAALAGGVSLAYVTPDPSIAQASALAIAQQHKVWGQTLNAAAVSSTVGSCPTGSPSVSGECINVTVSQGGSSGTPLPVFFSRIFTAMTPEVHATASSKVLLGNASPCMRPIAIPDSWLDTHDTTPDSGWTPSDSYDRYIDTGFPTPPPDADTYIAPTASGVPAQSRTT